MMKKIKITTSTKRKTMLIILGILIPIFVVFGLLFLNDDRNLPLESIVVSEEQIELIKNLILDQAIVDAVKDANQEHFGITQEEIATLDKDWIESRKVGVKSQIMENVTSNSVAIKLKELQKAHPEFVEIFIADKYGLNVGQTNITSDYYQADEEWWINAYNEGHGVTVIGDIEYDESAGMEVIGIFFPVTYGSVNNAIGVIKALISVEFLKINK